MTCAYLGKPHAMLKVACRSIEGYAKRCRLHYCTHPENRRTSGRPRNCIPEWSGPWKLPERATEAALATLCCECSLRASVAIIKP